MESYMVPIISSLFAILMAILGWAAVRVFNKLDSLSAQITHLNETFLVKLLERDTLLGERINILDQRIIRIETRCEMEHKDE